jgi:hypothetical protein
MNKGLQPNRSITKLASVAVVIAACYNMIPLVVTYFYHQKNYLVFNK